MMKLFRKIRNGLITKNKYTKYLAYAIGEIVLVVIGILIALSINNWNQERIERKIEITYIKSLIEDAETDLANLNVSIELNNNRIQHLDSLKLLCYSYSPTKSDDAEIMFQYVKSVKHPDFIKQTDRTLSQLKNSGGMRLIKDNSKIDAIINYERSFEKLYNQQLWYEGGLKDLIIAGVSIFNFKYLTNVPTQFDRKESYNTIKLINTHKAQIIELGNWASVSSAFTYAYLNFLMDSKKECQELIVILSKDNLSDADE